MTRVLIAPALAFVGLASACLLPLGGEEVGEVRIAWKFADDGTCGTLGVDTVAVQVSSKDYVSGTAADCIAGSVLLTELPAGSYDISLDAAGSVSSYSAREQIDVEGGFTSDEGVLTLKPQLASIDVGWSFDGDPRCTEAGVTTIAVQVIDDTNHAVAGSEVDCLSGRLTLGSLPTGRHTFVVDGLQNTERRWQGSTQATLAAGDNTALSVALDRLFANVNVRWLFSGANNSADCTTAGVESVALQMFDAAGVAVGGSTFACTNGVARFEDLAEGSYRFVADGFSTTGVLVAEEQSGNPRGVTQSIAVGENDVVVTLEQVE